MKRWLQLWGWGGSWITKSLLACPTNLDKNCMFAVGVGEGCLNFSLTCHFSFIFSHSLGGCSIWTEILSEEDI